MEPPIPPSTPASPFNPGRSRSPGGSSGKRPLLIGCGALLLLLGIAAIVLVAKRAEFVGWMFQKLEAQILAKLPEDVTPEERQQLDRSFDAAAEAIGSGTANQAKADQLNAVLLELAQGGRQISREDVLKLTHALEEVAGKKQAVPDV
ncbi:MAG: hypothetical protein QOH06_780 [Acidobacteriota bacterium]|nr:hypothetical protein [Acidobacteriota bacterium]